ncbi:Protein DETOXIFICATION 56 [Linum perenne]
MSSLPSSSTKSEDNPLPKSSQSPYPSPLSRSKWPKDLVSSVIWELKTQRGIVLPLLAMNLTWFAKTAITTAFLGRLGELQLAGGALGLTFGNVTGFSVLNGLCGAMEPICGQANGAKNYKLLQKTLVMAVLMLLLVTVPVAFLWLNVDRILICFGQEEDISLVAKKYLFYLLPDLLIISFLCPLKSYLSSQCVTVPILLSSALGLVFHVPVNILLCKAKGMEGVAMATWVTDLLVVTLLGLYVLMTETRKGRNWKEGGWLEQGFKDWIRLLKLSGPCCLSTCLEWWCWEILLLLTGHLANAKQAVSILAIVMNFDYLLFSVMLSLATCVSCRVSNELGANQPGNASRSSVVSMASGVALGLVGSSVMVAAGGKWGALFTKDEGIRKGVKKMMLLMAVLEIVNFPLAACGGIMRGTARPWLAMYANVGGFYLVALPLGVALAFKVGLGLSGLLIGFLVGLTACLMLLLFFIARLDWKVEALKAQKLTCQSPEPVEDRQDDPDI